MGWEHGKWVCAAHAGGWRDESVVSGCLQLTLEAEQGCDPMSGRSN